MVFIAGAGGIIGFKYIRGMVFPLHSFPINYNTILPYP